MKTIYRFNGIIIDSDYENLAQTFLSKKTLNTELYINFALIKYFLSLNEDEIFSCTGSYAKTGLYSTNLLNVTYAFSCKDAYKLMYKRINTIYYRLFITNPKLNNNQIQKVYFEIKILKRENFLKIKKV